MAGLPIDIKDMLEALGDIDTARQKPVTVAVLLDASAPVDLLDFIKDSFASKEANARISFSYYEDAQVHLPHACDLAVVAAGSSPFTGALSCSVRAAGTPTLVVTTLPTLVDELARASGNALLADDFVYPKNPEAAFGASAAPYAEEPVAITEAVASELHQSMGTWIVDVFAEKKLAFALCFPFVRKPLALDAVKATSAQNAAIGAVILIPGADMPVMTANQAKMILQIAAAYGQKMGFERVKELAGVVAGAFALRTVARQVVGSVPGLGWAVKGAIGFAGTQAMGRAAIAYFEATVNGGKPAEDAMKAARAEADRVAAIAATQDTRAGAVAAVAKTYASSAADKVRGVYSRAVPAAKEVAAGLSDIAGATPLELGKKAIDGVCAATGTTPSELGRRILDSALNRRTSMAK